MSHILVNCLAIERHIVWSKARELWPYNPQSWPEINLGIIMGIGCIKALDNRMRRDRDNVVILIKAKGRTRLLQIIISEASHLIWVLQCDREIQGIKHLVQQIKAKWIKAINNRLTTDRITVTKIKRDEAYTKLINTMWKHALKKKNIYHQNWLQRLEVFSG